MDCYAFFCNFAKKAYFEISRGPKLEFCACSSFGNSSGIVLLNPIQVCFKKNKRKHMRKDLFVDVLKICT